MLHMDREPLPTIDADSLAWIDTEQMVEVDRVMIEDLHIELIQMMENAGRNLARLVHHQTVGVTGRELGPALHPRWQRCQGLAGHLSDDPFAQSLFVRQDGSAALPAVVSCPVGLASSW